MPEYTFLITGADGRQETRHAEFTDDTAAIEAAGREVSAKSPVIAVTRGAAPSAIVLGAWEFEHGDASWWSEC